jgi:crotonobetainyl-CoA:carnitine CoA-transferase CaiB-like acyl-CoA transferase
MAPLASSDHRHAFGVALENQYRSETIANLSHNLTIGVGQFSVQIPSQDWVQINSATTGRTDWPGPEVGAFNEEVYGELLGLSAQGIARLSAKGVV